jgi:hypothetical protein
VRPGNVSLLGGSAAVSDLVGILRLAGGRCDFLGFLNGLEPLPWICEWFCVINGTAHEIQSEAIRLIVFGISPAPVLNADDSKRI